MAISTTPVNGGYYVSELQEYQRSLREEQQREEYRRKLEEVEYRRRQQNMYRMYDDTDVRAVAEQPKPKPAPKEALNKNLLLCEDI